MSLVLEKIGKVNGRIDKVNDKLDILGRMFNVPSGNIQKTEKGFNIGNSIKLETVYQSNNTTVSVDTHLVRDTIYPKHCHTESFEYLIVSKGRFLLKLEAGIRIMKKSECAAIPIGVEHSVIALEDNSEIIAVCIPPETAYEIKE